MSERNPEQECLLCQNSKATQKGSHLIPASLLASMIGPRFYEEGYRISPDDERPLGEFWGRSNLKNESTEVQKNDFIENYFFCPTCEKRLALIENEINPILTSKIMDEKQKLNFPTTILESRLGYITCVKVNSAIFRLYIYSLIWRWCIKYRFLKGSDFLATPTEVEWFRKILNDGMGDSLQSTLEKSKKLEIEAMNFVICGCFEEYDRSINSVLLHPEYRHPYCLVVNDLIILFSFKDDELNSPEPSLKLIDFSVDKRVINKSGPIKIVKSRLKHWERFLEGLANKQAEVFIIKYVTKLSKSKGLTLEKCRDLLDMKAAEIANETNERYGKCYIKAYDFLNSAES